MVSPPAALPASLLGVDTFMNDKKYEGTCYIGVVGPETIPVLAVTSIMQMERRDGDGIPQFITATKGYVARQTLINNFMASEHDYILLLDHDMIFEKDTLERLRSHGLPYVTGYYMRRQFGPMYSVWFEPYSGEWPHMPFLHEPEKGRLYELGASGWGCILIHRDVIESTRKILKGEMDVIEDDMDVWPYDLAKVLNGEEQIKPLRGVKYECVGSDIRYPFYARAAGYTLMGDPDVRPKHLLQYPLSPDDYSGQTIGSVVEMMTGAVEHVQKQRDGLNDVLKGFGNYKVGPL